MASLEAKLLGERAENYCDSDEGEHEEDRDPSEPSSKGPEFTLMEDGVPPPPPQGAGRWGGTSKNTGPKGVLRDWELYKAHEEQVRKEKEIQLIQMVKDTSLSCRTEAEEAKVQQEMQTLQEEIESQDLDELFSDKVLEEFIKKRMDMMSRSEIKPKFGMGLVSLEDGGDFLKVIDDSDHRIPVIVHIYDDKYPECQRMNDCLQSLSTLYPMVQFCKIQAERAGVTRNFKLKGIPALLVYKAGNMIGNFVQLKEEFGIEFFVGDVEGFLIENGMLEDRSNIPTLLKHKQTAST